MAGSGFVLHSSPDYFPVQLNCLNRLSVNAAAVDFYFVSEVSADNYRIYIIQTTIAQEKKVVLDSACTYLARMHKTILRTTQNREVMQSISGSRIAEDMAKIEKIRRETPFLEEDTGKEMLVGITDPSVDIWFVYFQEIMNTEFYGPCNNPQDDLMIPDNLATEDELKKFFRKKMRTSYAFLRRV